MEYADVLTQIHSRMAFSKGGPGLKRIGRLMERLGNPQDTYRTIHIAGTNGKGSTAAMTATVLQEAGYHVGLFTSPYLIEFRERIRIDNLNITESELVECFQIVMAEEEQLETEGYEPANEFELVTAICFVAFQRENVDFAVIEVGLGGRADPTNIIKKPEICCITPISLDHTAVLGNTVAEIAFEKAGIIKPDVPVVSALQQADAAAVIKASAVECNAELLFPKSPHIIKRDYSGIEFELDNIKYDLSLIGDYQAENASVAVTLCRKLGIEENYILRGLKNTRWPGRLQIVINHGKFLIDSGHNPDGVDSLCNAIRTYFPDVRVIAVIAMMKDKAYEYCISQVSQYAEFVIGTTVGMPRSLEPEFISRIAIQHDCKTVISEDIRSAIKYARQLSSDDTLIVICGSVYAAGEALKVLT